MDDDLIHDLCAGYALDALGPEDRRTFEAHLANCRRCRDDLAGLAETATALAYAAEPAEPPAALRSRILSSVRAEPADGSRFRRRSPFLAAAVAFAAVAAGAAIGLGVWAATLHGRLDTAQRALHAVPLHGAAGSLVRAGNGDATLVIVGLTPAPPGRTYETWVVQGTRAAPAGLFAAAGKTTLVRLSRHVPRGATVAVTLERAGGAAQPTTKPLLTAAVT